MLLTHAPTWPLAGQRGGPTRWQATLSSSTPTKHHVVQSVPFGRQLMRDDRRLAHRIEGRPARGPIAVGAHRFHAVFLAAW